MQDKFKKVNLFFFLALVVFLSGCNLQTIRPTLDPDIIGTIAAKTVQAQLAETKQAIPSTATQPIPTPEPTSTPTMVPTATITQTPNPHLTPATTAVTYAPGNAPIDNSSLQPAGDFAIPIDHDPANGATIQKNQDFDMTWTFKNTGTTTWNKNYYITYFGGNRIGRGDNSFFLGKEIKPGEMSSITVKMVAPDVTGNYKSIWMLMNDQKKAILELNVVINVP
jgi:hypothetical protein